MNQSFFIAKKFLLINWRKKIATPRSRERGNIEARSYSEATFLFDFEGNSREEA